METAAGRVRRESTCSRGAGHLFLSSRSAVFSHVYTFQCCHTMNVCNVSNFALRRVPEAEPPSGAGLFVGMVVMTLM